VAPQPRSSAASTERGLYKLWASPRSVPGALLRGPRAGGHPAQLHYAWDLESADTLDAAIRQTTLQALRWLDFGSVARPRVLDAGCGVGGGACQLAQRLPQLDIVGLSIVAAQVATARARALALGLKNVAFDCGSYLDTGFDEASFDGIYAIESFCHTPTAQKPRLLAEMLRVLRPGRRLVIVDGGAVREPVTAAERQAIQDVLDGWALPLPTPAAQLAEMAAQAGFEVQHVEDVTAHVLASADRIAAIGAHLLRPLAGLARLPGLSRLLAPLGMASPAGAARFADACVAQREVLRSGLGGYFIHVLRKPDLPKLSTAEPPP